MPGNKRCRVAVIDYEMGNLFSVEHACTEAGLEVWLTSDPGQILSADAAILPGVGAFGAAMENFRRLDLEYPIRDFIASGRPFMGICLGLQLLFTESEEFGSSKGMNLIPGVVRRFPGSDYKGRRFRIPQIGWNQIRPPAENSAAWTGSPLAGIRPGEYMYFVHSYCVHPDENSDILSRTDYEGYEYCSSILRRNVFAMQFHPEKSAESGMAIFNRWAENAVLQTDAREIDPVSSKINSRN